MTMPGKVALSLAIVTVVGSGVVLWGYFGEVILFDMASAAFLGCL